jgi:hypothetical protein
MTEARLVEIRTLVETVLEEMKKTVA